MRTYVITGATSFIGSQLVLHLLEESHRVIAVCRNRPKAVSKMGPHPNLDIVEANLSDYGRLHEQIRQADVFVHLAWEGTGHAGRDVEQIQAENVEHTLDAMQSAAQMGCRLFVDSGSQAEYGTHLGPITEQTPCQPFSAYGKAKLDVWHKGQELAQKLGLKYLHLRIFSLYGKGDHPWTLVMTCIEKMLRNEPVALSPCTQQWNFLHVTDAARQVSALCDYALGNTSFATEVFNIASEDTRPLSQFVERIKSLVGSHSDLQFGAVQSAHFVTLEPDMSKLRAAIGFVSHVRFDEAIQEIILTASPPENQQFKCE